MKKIALVLAVAFAVPAFADTPKADDKTADKAPAGDKTEAPKTDAKTDAKATDKTTDKKTTTKTTTKKATTKAPAKDAPKTAPAKS
jgi:DNA-binding protein HU-beta